MCTAGPGKTDIGGVDAERVHKMEQLDLFLDRRLTHGWRLQPIT
jgi:hypothetical protein